MPKLGVIHGNRYLGSMEQFDNPHSECEVKNSLWLDRLKQRLNESSCGCLKWIKSGRYSSSSSDSSSSSNGSSTKAYSFSFWCPLTL